MGIIQDDYMKVIWDNNTYWFHQDLCFIIDIQACESKGQNNLDNKYVFINKFSNNVRCLAALSTVKQYYVY